MNHWLTTHMKMIKDVRRSIIEKGYMPQFQDFPLKQMEFLLNGVEVEIHRLENDNNRLKEKIKELEKKEVTKV